MTENTPTPAQLIRIARALDGYDDTPPVLSRIAEAPETVIAERDELVELKDTYRESMVKLHKALEGTAAILAEVREYAEGNEDVPGLGIEMILSKLPADALAARDAEKWDEGYESGFDDEVANARGIGHHDNAKNPYRSERKAQ